MSTNTTSSMESLFYVLDQTTDMLQKALSCTYLEALAESADNLFQGMVLQEEISEKTKKELQTQYDRISLDSMSKEHIRKAYQLAILKGMKKNIQPNHQMTPDSIGLFVSYLMQKFMADYDQYSLLDPAVGTGNLLTTILNQQSDQNIHATGIDVDDLLIKLAYAGANLLKHPIQFYNQDALEPLFVDLADAVVCDLPVGYYPNDDQAQNYRLKAKEGHSYAHHLFIEQSIRYTKPAGFLFFLIPNFLFESPQADQLRGFLKDEVYIQAVIQLPLSVFKNKNAAKSILILQKKSEDVKAPEQVLLADLPSLTNKKAMEGMIAKIESWFLEKKRGQ